MKKLIEYILHNPQALILALLVRLTPFIPDRLYLKWMFRLKMGYKLNLDNPQTFSEKLQWLKLYNRKPEYTQMVDKYEAKKYVANIIGEEYIIPTLGVWDKFEDIDFDALPNQFVLKTTHGGGNTGVVICKDRSSFDKAKANQKLESSLKSDIYKSMKEWPYKNVKKRIIAEEYIKVVGQQDLPDYKFFCFNGEPKYCQVIRDRNTKETIDFYDMEWSHMPFVGLNPVIMGDYTHLITNGNTPVSKPKHLEDMISICKKLSKDIPFSRIDLYVLYDKEYFGEITFYPMSGLGVFNPHDWNYKFGELIKLPNKTV